VIAFINIKL